MKILFCDWTSFADWDIVQALHRLGHVVVMTKVEPKHTGELAQEFCNVMAEQLPDVVFSMNFAPQVAACCHRMGVRYLAWVYDNPQMLLYTKEIFYPTNFIFVFDSAQYQDLRSYGADTVYYTPMAVDAARIDALILQKQKAPVYNCDVAFVGSLYNEEHLLYDRLAPKLSAYDRGYLEALMQVQAELYGHFVLEEVLAHSSVLAHMQAAMPYAPDADSFASAAYVYANYFLGRKLTSRERITILQTLASRYRVNVYTDADTSAIPGVVNQGRVEYFEEAPFAFYNAKINLNVSLCTIQNGIPLRCFDILGSGGFLLTNYQADFEGLFEAGTDYVYYESKQDLYEKVAYYLAHETEREAIARHGHATVLAQHTYEQRLCEMLELVMQNQEGLI